MNAIEPYKAAPVAGTFRYVTAEVLADVRLDRIDRRNRSATYELAVASHNGRPLRARLMGVSRGRHARELGSLELPSGSAGRSRIVVPLPVRGGDLERVYLQLDGDGVHFIAEAPAPVLRRSSGTATGIAFVGCALLAILAIGAALFFPQTPAVASSASAVGGTVLHIGYAMQGFGRPDYLVRGADGRLIAAADLPQTHGDFSFAVPASSAHTSLHVIVRLRSPLGDRERDIVLPVVDAASVGVTGIARVVGLSAQRGPNAAGDDSVVVSYLAVGDGGTVDLLDRSGRTVASAPFVHVGTNRLVVGPGHRAESLVARVDVRRGATRATSSVAVPPSAAALVSAPALPPEAAAGSTQAPEAVTPLEESGTSDDVLAIDGNAIAGHDLVLRLLAHLRSMRVELQDDQGQSLAESDVAADATRATLPLPLAAGPRTYYVIVRYLDADSGEQTLVRSVIAQPG